MLQTLQAPSSQWTLDECAGWRPAIEAVAARPRRGAGANEGLKPRLSRCVAFAELTVAVPRPPRCCPAPQRRRCAQQLRRCGLLVPCARSAAEPRALRQQPRAAGALCPLRRRAAGRASPTQPARPLRAPGATQIAQQPRRAATRHLGSRPETQAARGSCFYLPAGACHPPRPIWRYRLRYLSSAAGRVFF